MLIATLFLLANTPTPGLALAPLRVIMSLPVAFVVGPPVLQRENTHAVHYKCGDVRRLCTESQINALTGGICISFLFCFVHFSACVL